MCTDVLPHMNKCRSFLTFVSDESGAITVDWTVLTAAIVGIGISAAAAVRTGTVSLGQDVDTSLSGATVADLSWAFARDLVSQSFGDGNFAGWSVARNQVFGEWGDMLGPFGNETLHNPLTYDVTLPDGMTTALVTFDLIIADSWDGVSTQRTNELGHTNHLGDSMRFIVDGQIITTEHFLGGGSSASYLQDRQGTVQIGDATYNLSMTLKDSPAHIGGAGWQDQRWAVSLEAVGAPADFQIGFSATVNQSNITNGNTTVHDESFGIQNFTLKGK
jgi:hypothetical protein